MKQPDKYFAGPSAVFKRVVKLMGNRFEISVVAEAVQSGFAENCIDDAISEIKRIEQLLTTYAEDSQTNAVNRSAGINAVKVDPEFFELVQRSLKISEITQGAFDISYGSIDKRLWNFDNTMTQLPDMYTAGKMVRLINYKNIIADETHQSIYLKEKGMRIGFGGIGKGYAAERAKIILKNCGISSGIVNAAGDIATWGYQPGNKPWTIGIADPDHVNKPFSYLEISDAAVATSGDYEKFVVINGKRYSHTINPKTGLPVEGIKSVTIISTNAEIADAMTTPVMIMGIEAGLNMINQMKHIGCIIIDATNKIYTSNNINLTPGKD